MKTKYLTTIASTLLALAVSTNAAVMNITVDSMGVGTSSPFLQNGTEPDGVLSLASKAFYGSFSGGDVNNNRTTNFNFLQGVIENWNDNRLPLLPAAVDNGATPADNGSIAKDTSSFTTATGYDYVVFHFGNGKAGDGNNPEETGWWAAWYLGGESSTFSLPVEGNPEENVGGFSSARYFNGRERTTTKVPDGGSTFLAFGLGLLGLGGVRRFLLKA